MWGDKHEKTKSRNTLPVPHEGRTPPYLKINFFGDTETQNIQSPKGGNFRRGIKRKIFKVPKGEISDGDKTQNIQSPKGKKFRRG